MSLSTKRRERERERERKKEKSRKEQKAWLLSRYIINGDVSIRKCKSLELMMFKTD